VSRVNVVVDDFVAERVASDLTGVKERDRFSEVGRDSRRIGDVSVADERGRQRELFFNPAKPRGDECRHGEVLIDVASRNAAFNAD
jgi:hypothetical protein